MVPNFVDAAQYAQLIGMPPQMLPQHIDALNFILTHPKAAIWINVGGAKTRVCASALKLLRPAGHTLIIAPLQVSRNSWPAELAKWGISANLRSFVIDVDPTSKRYGKRLTPQARDAEMDAAFDPTTPPAVWLASKDQVVALVERWEQANVHALRPATSASGGLWDMSLADTYRAQAITPWPFPTVVIDESQDFKNARAARTVALMKVQDQITRMVQLTGTPTPQSLGDLWSQVFLLDGGAALGERFTEFRDRYFRVAATLRDGTPVKWEPIPDALKMIHSACAHLAMSAEIPTTATPPIITTETVRMSPAAVALYEELKTNLILELATPTGKQRITADNAAVLRARLLQMASGTCYPLEDPTDPVSVAAARNRASNYIHIHDIKISKLVDIVRRADTPVLVAYRFQADKTRIVDRLAYRGIHAEVFDGSPQMVARWNNREIPVMLLQPASSGRGLNLQHGGRFLVWFTLPDSSEHWTQTNGRLARLGQTQQVEIILLVCEGTVDTRLYPNLQGKLGVQDELMAAAVAYTLEQITATLQDHEQLAGAH